MLIPFLQLLGMLGDSGPAPEPEPVAFVTPNHIHVLSRRDRTVELSARTRTITLSARLRTHKLPARLRTIVIPARNRTHQA